jgi:hypothetical protein
MLQPREPTGHDNSSAGLSQAGYFTSEQLAPGPERPQPRAPRGGRARAAVTRALQARWPPSHLRRHRRRVAQFASRGAVVSHETALALTISRRPVQRDSPLPRQAGRERRERRRPSRSTTTTAAAPTTPWGRLTAPPAIADSAGVVDKRDRETTRAARDRPLQSELRAAVSPAPIVRRLVDQSRRLFACVSTRPRRLPRSRRGAVARACPATGRRRVRRPPAAAGAPGCGSRAWRQAGELKAGWPRARLGDRARASVDLDADHH